MRFPWFGFVDWIRFWPGYQIGPGVAIWPMVSLRPRPHVSGYFRIRNFFSPDTATVHTYTANSTANPEKINPLSRVEKNISATNPITCGRVNPDIFLSDDVKSVSSHNVEGEQSKFPATISLYGACSEDILVLEEPWVLEWIRIPSDTCGRENVWIRKEKVADSKISGYVWTGP